MDIERIFENLGGTFLSPPHKIEKSLFNIKAFIFDWDGVFNNGMKSGDSGSVFSEIDSMGINLLRFSFWLKTGKVPHCFIITGMNNQTAVGFARREHFDGIVMNLKRKKLVLDLICDSFKIVPAEAAFIFDDVIDIETASACGLSFYVNRKSNPLLNDYIIQNRICDYVSAFSGENQAVREICELLMGLNGNFNQTLELRINFASEYENYLKAREQIVTNTELRL
jgi:3-deoxy-D-manno-octulosonate 8-phosphate phosphatase (KDO 8-P phosphatase)